MADTTALSFKHGNKLREDKKQKVNTYELGGGRIQASLLAATLTTHNIENTTICIVVDLSRPGNCIDSLLFWLNAVREQAQITLDQL
mmetsp:Transcript_25933/g.35308  ORF Transcript_25933/g.35308 Transcript_25933/m.35308 type:complete len:87 (-) Transcript_25933:763-1023(-)